MIAVAVRTVGHTFVIVKRPQIIVCYHIVVQSIRHIVLFYLLTYEPPVALGFILLF